MAGLGWGLFPSGSVSDRDNAGVQDWETNKLR
jgi:hypothetical protein